MILVVVLEGGNQCRVALGIATPERPGSYSAHGWHLTIDGRPATIYRTNRLMRGAAVKAGRHTLVYSYGPASFRLGAALSVAGLIALAALLASARAARGKNHLDRGDAVAEQVQL